MSISTVHYVPNTANQSPVVEFLHELAQPLTVLELEFAQVTEYARRKKLPPDLSQAVASCQAAVTQSTSLCQLYQEKLQSPSPPSLPISESFSLRSAIFGVVNAWQTFATQRRVQIVVGTLPGKAIVGGSELRFHQALNNVVKNAIESYDLGKNVSANQVVNISARIQGESSPEFVVCVRDFGTGIKPQHTTHLREGGQTTKPRGHGIGLRLVHQIIEEEFNGQVKIQSEQHKGTAVSLTFPLELPPNC